VFGSPSKHEVLTKYLRNLLVQSTKQEGQSAMHCADVYNSVRSCGCMFEEHHNLDFHILWEMVVSSNMDLKINAANLLKAIIWALDNPRGAETLPPGLVECEFDLHLRRLWGWSMEITGVVVVPAEAVSLDPSARRATTLFGLHVAPPLAVRGLYVKPGTMLALLASLGKKLLVSVIMFHFCLYLISENLINEAQHEKRKLPEMQNRVSQRKKKKVSAQTHIYHHVQRHGMHDVAFGISSSGYTDAWVPITASRYSINTFNLPIETAWRPCCRAKQAESLKRLHNDISTNSKVVIEQNVLLFVVKRI
ncbi:armadillo-like helical domain-containing protein, partial [Tanacetum coccineum]